MDSDKDLLKGKTKRFALDVLRFIDSLPRGRKADAIGNQLIRSGTSVGSNYRSACRAKSQADFIHKMTIVEEEADESVYWMELLVEDNIVNANRTEALLNEANDILSMTVASIKTARKNK